MKSWKNGLGALCLPIFLFFLLLPFSAFGAVTAPDTWNPQGFYPESLYQVGTAAYNGKTVICNAVPGRPPKNFRMTPAKLPKTTDTVNILPNAPAFDWSYGCTATSAAMMAGYYDNIGYFNMYTGPTNHGVCPQTNAVWGAGECPLSATHQGYDGRSTRGHVDDYWISYGSQGPDPYVVNGWPEHVYGDCTADFMGTNQWKYSSTDGSTWIWTYNDGTRLYDYTGADATRRDGCHGLRLFFESRGYQVLGNYTQRIYGSNGNTNGCTFADYMAEINAGRPVIIQVSGHSMLGVGYDSTNQTVYLHNTWDYSTQTMTWGGTYAGMQHYAMTVFQLAPAPLPVVTPSAGDGGVINPATPQTMQLGGTVTFFALPTAGYAVDTWSIDGEVVQTGGTYCIVPNVNADHTIKVTFARCRYTLVSWGSDANNQRTMPGEVSEPVAIAAGDVHSVALQADGKVACWGNDDNDQCDVPDTLTNVVAVTARWSDTLALTAEGAVVGWGKNDFGQDDIPIDWTNVVAITAGEAHTVALTADGKVHCVGRNDAHQCDVPADLPPAVAIAAGVSHTVALTAAGTVRCWGANDAGQCNVPPTLTGVKAVAAGRTHTIVLLGDGSVRCWGSDDHGETDVPPDLTGVTTIAAGPFTSLAITAGGAVVCWGLNADGQCTPPEHLSGVSAVAGGSQHSLALIRQFLITPSAGDGGAISPTTQQTVQLGGTVTFFAQPITGYVVDTWVVDGEVVQFGGTQYTLENVTADHTIAVTYTVAAFTVTPSADANGTIDPHTPQTVYYGEDCTFTANPATGYTVDSWYLDGNATAVQTGGTSFTLATVTADHAVKVTFKHITFTITPESGDHGGIAPNTAQTVNYGDGLTCTATPATGYTVAAWTVDSAVVQTGGTSYHLTNVTADHHVKVTFKLIPFTVTASAGTNGRVSPTPPQTVDYGGSCTFTALPNAGYAPDSWYVDGSATPAQVGGVTFKFTNVTANHTLKVTFGKAVVITPSAGTNGSISPNTAQSIASGQNITFTAVPNTGYAVSTWAVDNLTKQTGGLQLTLSRVTVNHTVKVTFGTAVTVTPSAGPHGGINPNTPQTVASGQSLTFSASSDLGYTVDKWFVDGTAKQTGGSTYTSTNITAAHTVTVAFKQLTFTLSPSAAPNGGISPRTVQTVSYGGSQTFTATANTGYVVLSWSVDNTIVQWGGASYTFTNVIASHIIKVAFTKPPILTPQAGLHGSIAPATQQTVVVGSNFTFTANPGTGYVVDSWLVDNVSKQKGGTSFTLTTITAGHTVKVTFKPG